MTLPVAPVVTPDTRPLEERAPTMTREALEAELSALPSAVPVQPVPAVQAQDTTAVVQPVTQAPAPDATLIPGTPFRTVDDVVQAYKELQRVSTPLHQENAQLRQFAEQVAPYLERDEAGNISIRQTPAPALTEQAPEGVPFVTKQELESEIEKRVAATISKVAKDLKVEEDVKNIKTKADFESKREAIGEMFKQHHEITRFSSPSQVAYDLVSNPALKAVYDARPSLYALGDAGLDIAKDLMALKQAPTMIAQAAQQAAASTIQREIAKEKASVGLAGQGTSTLEQDYSKLSRAELEKLLPKAANYVSPDGRM